MFRQLPRFVGFPNQIYVDTEFAFKSFEMTFKGKLPFFVSTFRFKDENTPIVDNLFFDIDSYLSLRVPWRNVRLLKGWCYKKDIPYILDFSGEKGFHFLMMTKEEIPKTELEKEKLRKLMYSVQMCLSKELGVEAFDEPTYGRLHFLIRFPTSKYMRRDEKTGILVENGYYCRNLTDEQFEGGLKSIAKLVTEPGEVPKKPKSDISIQEIADMIKDFKLLERDPRGNGVQEKILLQRAGMTVPTIEALGLPCLKEIVKHSHPTHYERIELVAWLKHMGYTDGAIVHFIANCNWTRYKYSITSRQVSTIKPRRVRCSFLRDSYSNFCEKCYFNRGRK